MQPFNLAALQKPLTVSEALHELRTYGAVWKVGFFTLLLVAIIPLLVFVIFAGSVLADGGALALLIMLSVGGLYGLYDLYRELNETAVMRRLAAMSNLAFRRDFYPTDYPGLPFRSGVYVPRALRTNEQLFLETGYMRPTFHDRRSSSAVTLTYVRVKLPRSLPQFVLMRNRGFSYLRNAPLAGEKLTLEGSFGDHFTLHAPKDYAQDALYIFTPDVMARFMDVVSEFDCEIVNDEMYFYSNKKMSLTKPETLHAIVATVGYVLQKFDRQTVRYRDDRQAEAGQPGRRDVIAVRRNPLAIVFFIGYLLLLVIGLTLRYT